MLNSKYLKLIPLSILTITIVLSPIYMAEAALAPYNSTQSDGDLIKVAGSNDVYIVKIYGGKRFKRLILNPAIFNQYQHLRWENVQLVTNEVLDSYTTSNLVRLTGDSRVWKLYPNGDTGDKRLITTSQQFISLGCDNDAIYTINVFEYDSYLLSSGALDQCPATPVSSTSSNSTTSSSASGTTSNTSSSGSGLYYYDPSFYAEYYDLPSNSSFPPQIPTGIHLHRGEKEINYNWGLNAPLSGMNADNFAVRWTKNMYLPAGTHTFTFVGDDGFRVWAGGLLLIDRWMDQTATTASADYVASGGNVAVKIEYYDHFGQASAKFSVVKK